MITKPWGSYDVIYSGDRYLVKIITVNPHARLSLQLHKHRSEHWIVLDGSIDIPKNTQHRLGNPSDNNLAVLEVQHGDILS